MFRMTFCPGRDLSFLVVLSYSYNSKTRAWLEYMLQKSPGKEKKLKKLVKLKTPLK